MHGSIVVSMLIKISHKLKRAYEYSLLKKIFIKIIEAFKYLGKGSFFLKVFVGDNNVFEESLFYKIYCKVLDFVYEMVEKFRIIVNKGKKGSVIDEMVSKLFKDKKEARNTFYLFFLFFGLTIITLNLFKGEILARNIIISFFIIIVSLAGIFMKNNYKEVFAGSLLFNFVKNIFLIDEGRWNSGRKL